MEKKLWKGDEELLCPHCGKGEEGNVEDFVIPGRVGPASRSMTDCGWCDGLFTVEKLSSGDFEIKKAEP